MGGCGGNEEGFRPRAHAMKKEEEERRRQRAGRRKRGGGAWAEAELAKVAGPEPTQERRRRSMGGGGNEEGCRPRAHDKKKELEQRRRRQRAGRRKGGGGGACVAAAALAKVAGPEPAQEWRRRSMGGSGNRKVAGPAPTTRRRRRSRDVGGRVLGVGRKDIYLPHCRRGRGPSSFSSRLPSFMLGIATAAEVRHPSPCGHRSLSSALPPWPRGRSILRIETLKYYPNVDDYTE